MEYPRYLEAKIRKSGSFEKYYSEKIAQKMPFIRVLEGNSKKNARLLEAGFGSCVLSIYLSLKGYDVTAIDISDEMVKLARANNKLMGGNVAIRKGDMFRTGFDDKAYDVVFHQGVLEHYDPHEIVKVLNEQKRIGSNVIFSVPSDRFRVPGMETGDERLWPMEKWRYIVKSSGLEITSDFSFPYFGQEHIGFVLTDGKREVGV